MFRKMLLLIFLFISSYTLKAQNKFTLENLIEPYPATIPIMEGDEIKGYWIIYRPDDHDKEINTYTLAILNTDLKKIRDTSITFGKDVGFSGCCHKDNLLVAAFFHDAESFYEYKTFDQDGVCRNGFKMYTPVISMNDLQIFQQNASTFLFENSYWTSYWAGKEGILSLNPLIEGKSLSFEINYSSVIDSTKWKYKGRDNYEGAIYVGNTETVGVFRINRPSGGFAKPAKYYLLGLNLVTGKKNFEIDLEYDEYKTFFYPMELVDIKGTGRYYVVGYYVTPHEDLSKGESRGILAWQLDDKGKTIDKKEITWKNDIGNFIEANGRGNIEKTGDMYIHQILKVKDGFLVIGEGYLRGLFAQWQGSQGAANTKVSNFIILQFDEKFNIKGVKIVEKLVNPILAPGAIRYTLPRVMGIGIAAERGFDYTFTMSSKDSSKLGIVFTDYKKRPLDNDKRWLSEPRDLSLHQLTYEGGQLSMSGSTFQITQPRVEIFPAKPGFVMVIESFSKENRVEYRLEKIN